MTWYLRWHSHKCILAQDPWVTCTETFMKPLSELLSLDRHSSLSPSTRKLKLQDMCFLQRCLCLVLWQKEKEKLWGLGASSGHHSCWNQKGNPVLIVSTLSYLKAFVMVATSAVKGPNSELWINEGEKNERFFFSDLALYGVPFLNSRQTRLSPSTFPACTWHPLSGWMLPESSCSLQEGDSDGAHWPGKRVYILPPSPVCC